MTEDRVQQQEKRLQEELCSLELVNCNVHIYCCNYTDLLFKLHNVQREVVTLTVSTKTTTWTTTFQRFNMCGQFNMNDNF
jgi:hypothetical protein